MKTSLINVRCLKILRICWNLHGVQHITVTCKIWKIVCLTVFLKDLSYNDKLKIRYSKYVSQNPIYVLKDKET